MSYLRRKYVRDSDSDSELENFNDDVGEIMREVISENNTKKNLLNNEMISKQNIKISTRSDEELLNEYNKLLQKYWGYPSLKQTQFEIIKKVIEENKDVCAILATGFGKSICYQLPHLITKKNIIVISPLIALMHEQGQEMSKKGIDVAVFNSDASAKRKDEEREEIIGGVNKLIFMTPEFFIISRDFICSIRERIGMVCIDEAHAVSTWGLDFRSSYLQLSVIKEWIPEIPILTLTATASVKVRDDICRVLKLNKPESIVGNFDRPNLLIRVLNRGNDVFHEIEKLLTKYSDEYVIIYCKTRLETETLVEEINKMGISANSYHAGMNDKLRKSAQQDFIDGKNKCICATIAFGMGINIPNVRLVIHYNCPKNLESYYQEIGRAGRDEKPSECVLFYNQKDFTISRFLIKDIPDPKVKSYQEEQIRRIEKYVHTHECRRKVILESFGQSIEYCTNCDNCIKKKNTNLTEKINMVDYTRPIYLFLNVLYQTRGGFGIGKSLNVLIGNKSKVNEYMEQWKEYGSGISFGNESWWKELVRYLIVNDYVIETQVDRQFFSLASLTKKGIELRTKLLTKYPTYLDLLKDSENPMSSGYNAIAIKLPEIKSVKSQKITKAKKNTKAVSKQTNDTKDTKNTKNTKSAKTISKDKTTKDVDVAVAVGVAYGKKLSQVISSDSDTD